jgi:hypothetical protein
MRLLWLRISDEANKMSLRSYIERNSIALLSNFNKSALDPASRDWLGHYSSEEVTNSGLWNRDYVEKAYDPTFLDTFERLVFDLKGVS